MKVSTLPVVILAGGLGTRLREETEFRPKPMVPIGGKPIIWHIMKMYSHFGFRRFIICLGYKGNMIKQFFLTYRLDDVDCTVHTKSGKVIEHELEHDDWEVTLVDTGQDCMTGGRVARIASYIDTDNFLLTYGDGLADINLERLLAFHQNHGRLVTMTGVQLMSRFGHVQLDGNCVSSFSEKKNVTEEWINGGFFVCRTDFLHYLKTEPQCVLEQEPLRNVAQDGQLMLYKHNGFWQCMDTHREHQLLEQMWRDGAPWKVWHEHEKTFAPAVACGKPQSGQEQGVVV